MYTVGSQVLKVLFRTGTLSQSKLISEVARQVSGVDASTASTLVRRVVEKWRGSYLGVKETQNPKRRQITITHHGLQEAFNRNELTLHEFARGLLVYPPPHKEEMGVGFSIYEALAQSETLAKEVELELKSEGLRRIEERNIKISTEKGSRVVEAKIAYELGPAVIFGTLFLILSTLKEKESMRAEIQQDTLKGLLKFGRIVRDGLREQSKLLSNLLASFA